jgi:hypothetical protein
VLISCSRKASLYSLWKFLNKYTVLYKFAGICPQYPISLKKLPKIQIDLYKEPLSNFGKTES